MEKIREETKLSGIKVKLHVEGKAKYTIANVNGKAKKILHRIVACMDCPMKTPAGTSVRTQCSSVEQMLSPQTLFSFQDTVFRFWLKFPFPDKVLSYY